MALFPKELSLFDKEDGSPKLRTSKTWGLERKARNSDIGICVGRRMVG